MSRGTGSIAGADGEADGRGESIEGGTTREDERVIEGGRKEGAREGAELGRDSRRGKEVEGRAGREGGVTRREGREPGEAGGEEIGGRGVQDGREGQHTHHTDQIHMPTPLFSNNNTNNSNNTPHALTHASPNSHHLSTTHTVTHENATTSQTLDSYSQTHSAASSQPKPHSHTPPSLNHLQDHNSINHNNIHHNNNNNVLGTSDMSLDNADVRKFLLSFFFLCLFLYCFLCFFLCYAFTGRIYSG